MHDGISFEQSGKPALVICTRPFETTGREIARTLGRPRFQFAVVSHPLGNLTVDELRGRAEDAYEQGIRILSEEGESEHERRLEQGA